MARYILIDNGSGYIWGDTASYSVRGECGSPIEAARELDQFNCEHGRTYEEVGRYALASNETGYHVYRAGGDICVIYDGRDQELIDAVERGCEYVTTLRCINAEG